ncbi:helix-turn-helix domain-containing protein [Hallella colorans]|uniref:helix-turn-helix domain-containing protein n=1 Tax=Hallella colorans TaxID=1703337 RepID=UPI0023F39496|nr:helix-turn-helix transcriptional regulator [Hallella colorans]
MKDRIREVMESLQMSQKDFAQFTGISEGSLSGIFNDRTRPTVQMIESIHDRLPNISVEWLLFGIGSMYKKNDDDDTPSLEPNVVGHSVVSTSHSVQQASSLFESQQRTSNNSAPQQSCSEEKTVIKYIDKPERKITEIRIFYDDQTWETFEPKR